MTDQNPLPDPIIVDFPGYRKRTFKTVEQVLRFGQSEYDTWTTFKAETNGDRSFNTANPADPSINIANKIRDQAQSYIDNPDPAHRANLLVQLESSLNSYTENDTYIATGSESGKIVLELSDENEDAACVLLSSIIDQPIPYGNVIDARKFTEAVYHAERAWDKPKNYAAAHKSLIKEINDDWEDLAKTAHLNIEAQMKEANQFSNAADTQASAYDRHHKRLFKLFRKKYDTTVANLATLENTYHKKLQLEAPATYWRNRKFGHISTSAFAAGVFLFGIYKALDYVRDHGPTLIALLPTDVSGNIGLGAIAVLTIPAAAVAWALRIFTRLFSHNLNMAADAAQRQTMITTYLALSNDPKANLGPDERILILNALFRPSENHGSSDAPPPNLLELAKAVSGKARN